MSFLLKPLPWRHLVVAISALLFLLGSGLVDTTASAGSRNKPKVGGPFTLTDHNGNTVTNEDFLGSYVLMYFGYTYCADICPTDLQIMVLTMEELGDTGNQVQPVFITVDPGRDTVAQLKDYVALFHPRLIGLTGTQEQIEDIGAKYYIHFSYVGDVKAGDYEVDHTSYVYLLGPDGKYLTFFHHATDPQIIADEVRDFMRKYDAERAAAQTQ